MSQIVTLYSDKEKTDALYPRTKVSAISDDNNTPLKELMTGMVKQEEGGTEEEVVTPVNADTLGGKLTANNVVFYEEEMVDEFGQVVVKNADKLNNKDGDYYDYRNSTLTLEEIQASTDLSGKIASASSVRNINDDLEFCKSYGHQRIIDTGSITIDLDQLFKHNTSNALIVARDDSKHCAIFVVCVPYYAANEWTTLEVVKESGSISASYDSNTGTVTLTFSQGAGYYSAISF